MKPVDNSGLNAALPPAPLQIRCAPLNRCVSCGWRMANARRKCAFPPNAGDSAPVDAERVAQIRKAVEDGSYPVTPVKIADAMIAAGLLLRSVICALRYHCPRACRQMLALLEGERQALAALDLTASSPRPTATQQLCGRSMGAAPNWTKNLRGLLDAVSA